MDDERIVDLYWKRDETAINETKAKYGNYCYSIAYNILKNYEDAEECENDTYLEAWRTIPPQKPKILSAYLGTITRRKSIDKWRKKTTEKRDGELQLSLQEFEYYLSDDKSINDEIIAEEMAKKISEFLRTLPEKECNVFLRRYWYFDSITEICNRYGYGQSKVKMMLKRTREKLFSYLEKEGMLA